MREYQFKQNAQGSGDELTNYLNAQEVNSFCKALNQIALQAGVPYSSVNSGTLEDDDNTVLGRAIQQLIIGSQVYNDNTVISSPNSIAINLVNNALVLPSALIQGFKVSWVAQFSNTGACTLKVGAYDVKSLKTKDNTDINAGQITAGSYVEAVYDGTVFRAITIAGVLQTGLVYFGAQQAGSLACDGATYNSTAYPNLFAKIGTTFGSAGAGTFKVPDFRDRVPRGAGSLINEGQQQEDAVQRSTGAVNTNGNFGFDAFEVTGDTNSALFVATDFKQGFLAVTQTIDTPNKYGRLRYDNARGSRTATETRVKAVGVNFWIYY